MTTARRQIIEGGQHPSETPPLYRTRYERAACAIGIVHLGYGAFHRAHQAAYVDDYMERTGDLGWGIAAVNLRASESEDFRKARQTAGGYLLKTTSPDGERSYRLVRAHCAFKDWATDREAAEALVSLPTVHAISMTVTESGYYLLDDWTLNTDHPIIAAEISGKGPQQSVYAYLASALKARCERLDQPINLLCCDNIRSNGKMLRRNFLSYLQAMGDEHLAQWVEANVSFPCSMVDRITPRATAQLVEEIEQLFHDDAVAPVQGESFIQWVLQNDFRAPMPDLETVGVQFVDTVDPYEEAKIRILNGGHTGLCYLGALAGYETFDQAMADPKLTAFFHAFEREEVLPGLDIDLPFDKYAYLDQIAARFSNTAIADQLSRICMDGFSKMSIFIYPTLESCLRQGITPRNTFKSIASWYVFARRVAAGTIGTPYTEPYWDKLEPLLARGREEEFARLKELWSDLPDRFDSFAPAIVHAIGEMEETWPG